LAHIQILDLENYDVRGLIGLCENGGINRRRPTIYRADNAEVVQLRLDEFEEKWDHKYPPIG